MNWRIVNPGKTLKSSGRQKKVHPSRTLVLVKNVPSELTMPFLYIHLVRGGSGPLLSTSHSSQHNRVPGLLVSTLRKGCPVASPSHQRAVLAEIFR